LSQAGGDGIKGINRRPIKVAIDVDNSGLMRAYLLPGFRKQTRDEADGRWVQARYGALPGNVSNGTLKRSWCQRILALAIIGHTVKGIESVKGGCLGQELSYGSCSIKR